MTARPVTKWAGGKTFLLPEILARLPVKINTYYEPFLGEGAVSYQACLNLFLEHGFEEAKARVLEMKKNILPGALGGRR